MTGLEPLGIQANLGTVGKFADGETRNWSLFVFFRILNIAELQSTQALLVEFEAPRSDEDDTFEATARSLLLGLSNSTAMEVDLAPHTQNDGGTSTEGGCRQGQPEAPPDGCTEAEKSKPLHPFLAWLRLLTSRDNAELAKSMDRMWPGTSLGEGSDGGGAPPPAIDDAKKNITELANRKAYNDIFKLLGRHALSARDQGDATASLIQHAREHLQPDNAAGGARLVVAGTIGAIIRSFGGSDRDVADHHYNTIARLFLHEKSADEAGLDPAGMLDRFCDMIKNAKGADALRQAIVLIIYEIAIEFFASIDDRVRLAKLLQVLAGLTKCMSERPPAIVIFSALFVGFLKIVFASPQAVVALLRSFGGSPAEAGFTALRGSLPLVCLYELLRQLGTSTDSAIEPLLRSVDRDLQGDLPRHMSATLPVDRAPINIAFSHTGLAALGLAQDVLDAFPEAFRDGMAARAARLGDTGPSAPENWDGELGSRSIHGYYAGGFLVGEAATECEWATLREDIRLFNGRIGGRGRLLRLLAGLLYKTIGIEVLHIELGQDPYGFDAPKENAREERHPRRLPYRMEHFGFRDGISQPFVDMGLGDPPAGGQTPDRERSWTPVAAGEIFLGRRDADGNVAGGDAELLRDGTYLVFRKLEQDVFGFRSFIRSVRKDKKGQDRLAASFMGRWPNGMPLVLSPDEPGTLENDPGGLTNAFLYAEDDPKGRKCPLGAHIRRSNPRDIGGHGQVMRHRILRRGISFGGRLIGEGEVADRAQRGLLFIAANSRIEQQFEVIQADWINGGEFLGQAGLGKCPIAGANDGKTSDQFVEAGMVAPITHLRRFVLTRGGDYFFAPGLGALTKLACGHPFKANPPSIGAGRARTPDLFDEQRIEDYVKQFLAGRRSIEIGIPDIGDEETYPIKHVPKDTEPSIAEPVVIVGKHADVTAVLADNGDDCEDNFYRSVKHYRRTAHRVTRGRHLPIATERGPRTGAARTRLFEILDKGWMAYVDAVGFKPLLDELTSKHLEQSRRRARISGHLDLVQDMATEIVFDIVTRCYGIPGPDWTTEIAMALPFARQHVGQLHPDWLAAYSGKPPANPGKTTLQIWSLVIVADLIGNVRSQLELEALSTQAGAEFLDHIGEVLSAARRQHAGIRTLVDAFVSIERCVTTEHYPAEEYYLDVAAILLEMASATMVNIPAIFGQTMNTLLDNRVDLASLVPLLLRSNDTKGLARLIYETDRLAPAFGLFLRHSEKAMTLPFGGSIDQCRWIVALIHAANLDKDVFPEPLAFSLAPYLSGPPRDIDKYLLFGAKGSGRACWGQERLALQVLMELIQGTAKLEGLRKVPGPEGELKRIMRVPVGLKARLPRD